MAETQRFQLVPESPLIQVTSGKPKVPQYGGTSFNLARTRGRYMKTSSNDIGRTSLGQEAPGEGCR